MSEGGQKRKISFFVSLMIIITAIVLMATAIFTIILVRYRVNDLISLEDTKLLTAAELTREMLGTDFHDRIVDEKSISKEQFRQIVLRNDDLCRRLDLQYLWSVLIVENRIVFTFATHSNLNDSSSPCASFFETHRDPAAFASAIRRGFRPSFSTFHNEWGAGRMVLIPRKDTSGRTYIFGASVQLSKLNSLINETVLTSCGIGLLAIAGAFVFAMLLARSFSKPIAQLTEATGFLASGDFDIPLGQASTRELHSLTLSIDRMRQGLKQSIQDLRESEEKHRHLFETMAQGVVYQAANGEIISANPAAERILGLSLDRLRGKTSMDLGWKAVRENGSELPGAEHPAMISLRTGAPFGPFIMGVHQPQKNICVWISVSAIPLFDPGAATPYQVYSTFDDITERKRAQEELQHLEARLQRAEKMEALGTLAGGVAHDLNNVLGVFVGYAELLLFEIPKDNPLRSDVERIKESGMRAAAIVQDLLTLARRGVTNVTVLNLNTLITDFQKTPEYEKICLENSLLKIRTELAANLQNIKGAPTHIAKTFMNLLINAVEAMPNGGQISVKTESRHLERPVHGYDEVQEGEYTVLSVVDTGNGIAEADMSHIFEPFFTKKVMGRSGTGLGLAIVWSTVKDLDGYIDVQSTQGTGTTFTLYFPVTLDEIGVVSRAVPLSEYAGNNEAILVVDDVKEQREMATTMLKKLNYQAQVASSGEEALDYLKTHQADLIVLDMIMYPGMDGLDTYKSILAIHPHQKVLIVSGYSATERVLEAQALGAGDYINKPYTLEKLGRAVKKELADK